MSRFEKDTLVVERLPSMAVVISVGGSSYELASWEWGEVVNRVALRPLGGRSVECGAHDGTGYIEG